MKIKKNQRIIGHKGTIYRLTTRPDGQYTAVVHIERYRPKAIIFKWIWADSFSFWLDDFNSIEEGIMNRFTKFCQETDNQLEIKRKWEEFEKTY